MRDSNKVEISVGDVIHSKSLRLVREVVAIDEEGMTVTLSDGAEEETIEADRMPWWTIVYRRNIC